MALSPEEQAEMQSLQNPAPGGGLSPEEQAEMKSLQGQLATPGQTALGDGADALGAVGKGLDALAAPVHAAIGGALQLAYPSKKIFNADEALQGWNPTNLKRTPGVDDYMKRAGIAKPGFFGGLVMNAATDPLTYLSLGGEAAAKMAAEGGLEGAAKAAAELGPQAAKDIAVPGAAGAAKALPGPIAQAAGPAASVGAAATSPWGAIKNAVLNPVGAVAKPLGTAIYQKGVAPILQAARKAGKGDITDFLMNNLKLKGTSQGMANQLEDALDKTGQEIGDRISAAKGTTIPFKQMLDPYIQKVQQLVESGQLTQDQAQAAVEKALAPQMEYVAKNGSDIPIEVAHTWRQGLDANTIPQAVWGEGATAGRKLGNQMTLTLRGGMNDSIDTALNRAEAGSGDAFRGANRAYGNIVGKRGAQAAAQKTADAAQRARLFSPWDAAYVAGGAGLGSTYGHAGEGAIYGLLARKGIQAAQSPWALTNIGMGLNRLGTSKYLAPALSAGLRQGYKDITQ